MTSVVADLIRNQVKENEFNTYCITDDSTGKVYRLGRLLGKGGFAKCYALTDVQSNMVFAGKVISKSSLSKPNQKQKILREVELHSSLSHENIVSLHGFFEDSKNMYIILELCNKKSLVEVINERGKLTEPEVRYYLRQIISACRHMHGNHIVHRDLKLGNMLLTAEMKVKIADFGLATRITHDGERKVTVCGTPNYIAPEVILKHGHSYEADIWSLGCIVYAMLCGRPPFESSSIQKTYVRIATNKFCIPPEFSSPAKRLITWLLAAEPSHRPSLDDILEHEFMTSGFMPEFLPVSCCHTAPKFSPGHGHDIPAAATQASCVTELHEQQTVGVDTAAGTLSSVSVDNPQTATYGPADSPPVLVSGKPAGSSGGSSLFPMAGKGIKRTASQILLTGGCSNYFPSDSAAKQEKGSQSDVHPVAEDLLEGCNAVDIKCNLQLDFGEHVNLLPVYSNDYSQLNKNSGQTAMQLDIVSNVGRQAAGTDNRIVSLRQLSLDVPGDFVSTADCSYDFDQRIESAQSSIQLFQLVAECIQSQLPAGEKLNVIEGYLPVMVSRWVDYRNKYGFAYQFSDGRAGILFNDLTQIIISSDTSIAHSITSLADISSFSVHRAPPAERSKLLAVLCFQRYMHENLIDGSGMSSMTENVYRFREDWFNGDDVVFLRKWLRVDDGIVMELSNGTVQLNVFKDHAKVVLSRAGIDQEYLATLFVKAEDQTVVTTFKCSDLHQFGCDPQLAPRLNILRNLLQRIIDFETTCRKEKSVCVSLIENSCCI